MGFLFVGLEYTYGYAKCNIVKTIVLENDCGNQSLVLFIPDFPGAFRL